MNLQWCKTAVLLIGLLGSGNALGHSQIEGAINLYLGMLHPFYNISAVLVMIGLGGMLGRLDEEKTPPSLTLGYCAVVFCSLLLTFFIDFYDTATPLICLVLLQGLLVAADKRLPQVFNYSVVVVCALLLGIAIRPDAEMLKDNILLAIGTWLSLSVCTLLVMVITRKIQYEWQIITLRVIGAWLSAYGVLMAALQFKS